MDARQSVAGLKRERLEKSFLGEGFRSDRIEPWAMASLVLSMGVLLFEISPRRRRLPECDCALAARRRSLWRRMAPAVGPALLCIAQFEPSEIGRVASLPFAARAMAWAEICPEGGPFGPRAVAEALACSISSGRIPPRDGHFPAWRRLCLVATAPSLGTMGGSNRSRWRLERTAFPAECCAGPRKSRGWSPPRNRSATPPFRPRRRASAFAPSSPGGSYLRNGETLTCFFCSYARPTSEKPIPNATISCSPNGTGSWRSLAFSSAGFATTSP